MTRILIVDDEAGIRHSLAGILGDEGFETTAVADGALTPARSESPALAAFETISKERRLERKRVHRLKSMPRRAAAPTALSSAL